VCSLYMPNATRLFTMCGCRNDPALAAAELALAIEKAALGTGAALDKHQRLLCSVRATCAQSKPTAALHNQVHLCRCNRDGGDGGAVAAGAQHLQRHPPLGEHRCCLAAVVGFLSRPSFDSRHSRLSDQPRILQSACSEGPIFLYAAMELNTEQRPVAGASGCGHPRHGRRAAGRRHTGGLRNGGGDRAAAALRAAHRNGVCVPSSHQR
jgi:hypothetical protein